MKISEYNNLKVLYSIDYNYIFNKSDGYFIRWGVNPKDDPRFSKYGPEILDIEVTTICNNGCPFCYKSNTVNGNNMSFEMFKTIIDKIPRTLTQIAIGADASATSNPDLFKMMEYTRSIGYIPNITVANITDETADRLSKLAGAVAVSRYADKNKCYDSVKRLTDREMTQVNIHIMLSAETYEDVLETIQDYSEDTRLSKLNAIVLLSLKKKGRGEKFNPVSRDQFNELMKIVFKHNVPIGFDSCTAHKFMNYVNTNIEDKDKKKSMIQCCEPCESTLFSSYINVYGDFYPCSFIENTEKWKTGINVTECEDFIKDVWMNERTVEFRKGLLAINRKCPYFEV